MNIVVAVAVPKMTQRFGNARVLARGLAMTLIGMAWLSRLSADTAYLIGVALAIILIGVGQGATLSPLTVARYRGCCVGRCRCRRRGRQRRALVGGQFGLGVLVGAFAAAGSGIINARTLLAHRVATSLIGGTAMLALALVLVFTLIVRPAMLQLEKEAA